MTKKDNTERPQADAPASPGGTGLNRRHFIQSTGALGLMTTALGGLIGGYGAAGISSAFAAAYDAKKYAGTKISFLMVGGEKDDPALRDLLPELKAETGIEIEITAPAIGPLIQKTLEKMMQSSPSVLRGSSMTRWSKPSVMVPPKPPSVTKPVLGGATVPPPTGGPSVNAGSLKAGLLTSCPGAGV